MSGLFCDKDWLTVHYPLHTVSVTPYCCFFILSRKSDSVTLLVRFLMNPFPKLSLIYRIDFVSLSQQLHTQDKLDALYNTESVRIVIPFYLKHGSKLLDFNILCNPFTNPQLSLSSIFSQLSHHNNHFSFPCLFLPKLICGHLSFSVFFCLFLLFQLYLAHFNSQNVQLCSLTN